MVARHHRHRPGGAAAARSHFVAAESAVGRLGRVDTAGDRGTSRVLTVPNALSVARLALVPVFLWLLLRGDDGLALLVLVVSTLTDFLDGFLARRLHQVTRLGQLLDPAADRLFVLACLLGLAVREILPWWLAVLIVSRDVFLLLVGVVLVNHGVHDVVVVVDGDGAVAKLAAGIEPAPIGGGCSRRAWRDHDGSSGSRRRYRRREATCDGGGSEEYGSSDRGDAKKHIDVTLVQYSTQAG